MKVLSIFVSFLFKQTLFFRQIMLFSVLNDRNWSPLLRCITNVRIIVLPWCLHERQTAKYLRFHSLFQKPYNKRLKKNSNNDAAHD